MNKKDNTTADDWGFGNWRIKSDKKSVQSIGNSTIMRQGLKLQDLSIYQYLKTMPTLHFVFFILISFTVINSIFALAYYTNGLEELYGMPDTKGFTGLLYAYFFSIQTFTSVGYGGIYPHGLMANFISTINAFVGLISFAIVTGLLFARFSRPSSKILFSDSCLLTKVKDNHALVFRIVNARNHAIHDLTAKVVVSFLVYENGAAIRRYYPLELERSAIYLFPLNWTIVHLINSNSPLYNQPFDTLQANDFQLLAVISGYDEAYGQSIYQQHDFDKKSIKQGLRFAPMYYVDDEQNSILELNKLNELMPLE
jgi:inward rectifier potassium channel